MPPLYAFADSQLVIIANPEQGPEAIVGMTPAAARQLAGTLPGLANEAEGQGDNLALTGDEEVDKLAVAAMADRLRAAGWQLVEQPEYVIWALPANASSAGGDCCYGPFEAATARAYAWHLSQRQPVAVLAKADVHREATLAAALARKYQRRSH